MGNVSRTLSLVLESVQKYCYKAVLNLEEKSVILNRRAANDSGLKIREQSVGHSAGTQDEKNKISAI